MKLTTILTLPKKTTNICISLSPINKYQLKLVRDGWMGVILEMIKIGISFLWFVGGKEINVGVWCKFSCVFRKTRKESV